MSCVTTSWEAGDDRYEDSAQPKLYFVPVGGTGVAGTPRVLNLTGPAADITGEFNLNGIGATSDGKTLLVAHSANGAIYAVDPVSSAGVGVQVPFVNGTVLEGQRLWVVQNLPQPVTRWQLSPDLTSGSLEKTITSPLFHVPTTAALHGNQLAVVNGKFDTGFPAHRRPVRGRPRGQVSGAGTAHCDQMASDLPDRSEAIRSQRVLKTIWCRTSPASATGRRPRAPR